MAGRTDHYGLSITGAGDSLSDDGYKHISEDRRVIDRKLYQGAEGHHHLGGTIALAATPAAPTVTRFDTGGLIPAATRVYYKIALVSTAGDESAASVEAYIDTPSAVVEPAAPTPTFLTTGGALNGGDYYYVLSAYKGANSSETRALASTFITVNSTTGTNKVTLTYPSKPSGATGFNIYRRSPGETRYFYLTSVDLSGATPATSFVDTGSIAENCDRSVPVVNSTNSTNRIVITYPGATPVVPTGYTWKIYRTYLNGQYTQSLLKRVVEFTSEATPRITTFFTDVGNATGPGIPVTVVPTSTNPSKIILTDAAEVQGTLPPANVAGYPYTIEFSYGGTLSAAAGTFVWFCEFDHAIIQGCRAILGVGKSPASTSVIIDVNVGRSQAATPPTPTTIFTTQANRPTITVGKQFSTLAVPNRRTLILGDMLSVDIDQAGGGATPTDSNLLVNIYLWVVSDKTTSVIP